MASVIIWRSEDAVRREFVDLEEWTILDTFSYYTLDVMDSDHTAIVELDLDDAEELHEALGESLRRHGRL